MFEDLCVLGDLKYLTIDQLNSLHKQITQKEQALVQAATGGGRNKQNSIISKICNCKFIDQKVFKIRLIEFVE